MNHIKYACTHPLRSPSPKTAATLPHKFNASFSQLGRRRPRVQFNLEIKLFEPLKFLSPELLSSIFRINWKMTTPTLTEPIYLSPT